MNGCYVEKRQFEWHTIMKDMMTNYVDVTSRFNTKYNNNHANHDAMCS
jgi:hypothetical protein